MVEHLERHAAEDGIDLLLDTTVDCIDQNDDGWLVWTSSGKIHTRQLIVATGHQNTPVIPEWKGRSDFKGELLHSSEYRNPDAYRGTKVLVVGSGNWGWRSPTTSPRAEPARSGSGCGPRRTSSPLRARPAR